MTGPAKVEHVDGRLDPGSLRRRLRELGKGPEPSCLVLELGGEAPPRAGAFEAVLALDRPVIARLEGPAGPDDLALALACDLILATPDLRLAVLGGEEPGFSPGLGWLLARRLGARAGALCFRAAPLDAATAMGLGLVDEVAPSSRLEARIAECAAVGRTAAVLKRALGDSHRLSLEEAVRYERYLTEAAAGSS